MTTERDVFLISNSGNTMSGVTTWMHQMARLFQEHGHRVHVIGVKKVRVSHPLAQAATYPVTFLYKGQPPEKWQPHGLRDHWNRQARRKEAERLAADEKRVNKLSKIFSRARPGGMIVVAQVWAMNWVARADTAGMPVIGMNHNSFDYTKQFGRFKRIKKQFRDSDRFLALTREDADLWINDGMTNADFIPNALPHLPEHPSPRDGKTVVSLGRLSEQKGIDMLLQTWQSVTRERPDWTLKIYGSGPDEPDLKSLCTELGLDDSVRWMGRTDDVPGAFRDGSAFVLSSRGEGFPLTLMEAMASGLPSASFDCAPGVREIVRDGEDGLLAPPGRTEQLADRLLTLTGDRDLRDAMGERARVNVQRFTEGSILEEWERLFALLET